MEQQQNKQLPLELSSQLVSIMTTEHYTLQTGRSITTAETNGRSSLFVGAVSSGLIALTFVGQLSHLGTAFFVFSLVVLPTLFFMRVITFERVLQSGSADVIYARGINRIRHLYLEYAPQMQPYFILSAHDDSSLPIENLGARHRAGCQVFLSMAGMMAMLNSVLAGSFPWPIPLKEVGRQKGSPTSPSVQTEELFVESMAIRNPLFVCSAGTLRRFARKLRAFGRRDGYDREHGVDDSDSMPFYYRD